MKADDVPVIGETEPTVGATGPTSGKWMGIGVAAAAVVAMVAILGGEEMDTAAPLPEPAPVTTTTAPLGADPTIVESPLTWREATGLAPARQIGDILNFDGAWHAFGRDRNSLAVWRSNDGIDWARLSTIATDPDVASWVADAAVIDDHLVVAAAGVQNRFMPPADGAVLSSLDGQSWIEHELPGEASTPDASTYPYTVNELSGRPVIHGFRGAPVNPEPVVAALPDAIGEAVEMRDATVHLASDGRVRVTITPGISIMEATAEELGVEVDSFSEISVGGTVVWTGDDLDSLDPAAHALSGYNVQRLTSGELLGQYGDRLAVSTDGLGWSTVGPSFEGFQFATWNEGAVVLSPSAQRLEYWLRDAEELVPLFPGGYLTDPGTLLAGPAASQLGIAATTRSLPVDGDPVTRTMIHADGARQLFLTHGFTLELVRNNQVVADLNLWNTQIELTPEGLIVSHLGEPFITVPVDEWLAAMDRHLPSLRSSDRVEGLIFSLDGRSWSVTPWAELGEANSASFVDLLMTDGFIMVVERTVDGLIDGVWVGRLD